MASAFDAFRSVAANVGSAAVQAGTQAATQAGSNLISGALKMDTISPTAQANIVAPKGAISGERQSETAETVPMLSKRDGKIDWRATALRWGPALVAIGIVGYLLLKARK